MTGDQAQARARASELWRVARDRARAAADIAEPAPAIVLLREAVLALVLAQSARAGQPLPSEPRAVAEALGSLLADTAGQPWHDRVRSIAELQQIGQVDQLSPAELHHTRVALEQAVFFLQRRVDPRSARTIRLEHRLRLGALAIGWLLLIAIASTWWTSAR